MSVLVKEFTPENEHQYVQQKGRAYLSLSFLYFGLFAYGSAQPISENYGELWLAAAIIINLILVGFTLISFTKLMNSLPTIKHFFWNFNCQDEYLNYVSHRATKYCANAAILSSMILVAVSDRLALSGVDSAMITLSISCFAYSAPLLFWLRGDNNDE